MHSVETSGHQSFSSVIFVTAEDIVELSAQVSDLILLLTHEITVHLCVVEREATPPSQKGQHVEKAGNCLI